MWCVCVCAELVSQRMHRTADNKSVTFTPGGEHMTFDTEGAVPVPTNAGESECAIAYDFIY